MIQENKKTKRNVLIIVIGLILVVAVATLSYALWTRNFTETGVNKNVYDCFEISYQETKGEGVTLEHGYPQTDEEGMQNNPYEITVKNTCKTIATYNVILNKENSSTLEPQYLKVAVGDNYKNLNEYETTTTQSISGFNNAASYIIGTGVLTPDTTKIIDVRSWMDENTSVSNGTNKSFTFKITIEATSGLTNDKLLATNILQNQNISSEMNKYSDGVMSEEEMTPYLGRYIVAPDTLGGGNTNTVGKGYEFRSDIGGYNLTGMVEVSSYAGKEGYYVFSGDENTIFKIKTATETEVTSYSEYHSPKHDAQIYETVDDDGTSYVLRGDVVNNYVKFADKDWRVVRINGDGTIRLVLNSKSENSQVFNTTDDGLKYVGYTYDNDTNCTKALPCKSTYVGTKDFKNSNGGANSNIKAYLEDWYHTNLDNKDNQIAYGTYCNDTTISSVSGGTTYFGTYKRLDEDGTPSLKCPDTTVNYGGVYKLKVGLLTAEEMDIAGLDWYYPLGAPLVNYLSHNYSWWTMSPRTANSSSAYEFYGSGGGISSEARINDTYAVLPVINLNSNIQITGGDGTESNPYVVD